MTRRFQRTIENFICCHCRTEVTGNGYTNHCPTCLWSVHCDVNPGDRAEACGGQMEPVQLEKARGAWYLRHRCTLCRIERRNRLSDNDNKDVALKLPLKAT